MDTDDNTTNISAGTSYTATTGNGVYLTIEVTGDTCTCSNSGDTTIVRVTHFPAPPPRRLLIPRPKGWTRDTELAFADLLNHKTRTGWIVSMLIDGEVVITDPNIERRTMEEFLPLLTWRASRGDKRRIDEFVAAHPLA